LSEHFESAFDGMTLEHGPNRTVLVGDVRDQAQLYGLLDRLQEFGIELLAVEPADISDGRSEPGAGRLTEIRPAAGRTCRRRAPVGPAVLLLALVRVRRLGTAELPRGRRADRPHPCRQSRATPGCAQLRKRGIEAVIISGIATNICREPTAPRDTPARLPGVFLSDGTATREMDGWPVQELQRATLASLGVVFTQLATVQEVTEQIQASSLADVARS
jgi:hypothetical protein